MKTIQIIALVAAIAVVSPAAQAQSQREKQETAVEFLAIGLTLAEIGIRVDDMETGYLNRGQTSLHAVDLRKGQPIVLVASGSEDAFDVDIRIFDEDHDCIFSSTERDKHALAQWTALWTGRFYIAVTMAHSHPQGAQYLLVRGTPKGSSQGRMVGM